MFDLFCNDIVSFKLFAENDLSKMSLNHDELVPTTIEHRDEPLALVVGVVMNHQAEIAVERSNKLLGILGALTLLQLEIVEVYAAEGSTESALADVDTSRLNHCTDI